MEKYSAEERRTDASAVPQENFATEQDIPMGAEFERGVDILTDAMTVVELCREAEEANDHARRLIEESGHMRTIADKSLSEKSSTFGLSDTELANTIESVHFAERSATLRERLQVSYSSLLETVKTTAAMGAAALFVGMAEPALGETTAVRVDQLQDVSAASRQESVALPTYEAAKRALRESILTASEEHVAFFYRPKEGGPMQTLLLKKGESVSVSVSEQEFSVVLEKMRSREVDIEQVHTHPLSAIERTGFISGVDADRMRTNELPRGSFAPSPQDWMSLITDDDAYAHPGAQYSARVIDPAGEWEYGISDSAHEFVQKMRKAFKELTESLPENNNIYTPEEQAYLSRLTEEHKETFFIVTELNKRPDDPLARNILAKLVKHTNAAFLKHLPIEDLLKFNALSSPISPTMTPAERETRITKMKQIAESLGLRIAYTPN